MEIIKQKQNKKTKQEVESSIKLSEFVLVVYFLQYSKRHAVKNNERLNVVVLTLRRRLDE